MGHKTNMYSPIASRIRAVVSVSVACAALLGAPAAVAQEASTDEGALRPWTLRVHYWRANGNYAGWGVYAWKGPNQGAPKWPANWKFDGRSKFGAYYDVVLGEGATSMEFLITDGKGNKNCARDQKYTLPADIGAKGAEIWLREGDCKIHTSQPKEVLVD